MWHLFINRLISAVPTLFGISLLAFVMIRLVPGDPVTLMLGERGGSPEAVAEIKASLGLDKSLPTQYFLFLKNIFSGDLGTSIVSKRTVLSEFADRFPATIELSIIALLFAVILGLPLGVLAACARKEWQEKLLMGGSLIGYSMPIFWWGLILILLCSVMWGITPVAGRIGVQFDVEPRTGFLLIDVFLAGQGWSGLLSALHHLMLPMITLGTLPLAAIARMTRASLQAILREDYIRTAHAKGLPRQYVIMKHALANALVPIVTVIGLMGSQLLTGAILTETLFAWPGIGRWLVASVNARDYPVIQGGLLLISVVVITVNFIVDMIYVMINPQMRVHG